MMEKLHVGLGNRSYPIYIGENVMGRLPGVLKKQNFPGRVAVVVNPTVKRLYGDRVLEELAREGFEPSEILIPDGEEYKTLGTMENIFDKLIAGRFDRTSGLIALGGGVIGDITGFAAATYLRGIPFVQVPTTLLAQVDSSVGGKTAVNHPLGKNLIGAFYQPRLVFIDIATLRTLSDREFSAGMAEVVKYGVIRDRKFFEWLVSNSQKLLSREGTALVHAIKKSCQIKANIVEIDETEGSLRAILNFGHTFGHAIETLAGYGKYLHGEAISIGMVAAADISAGRGLSSEEDAAAIRSLLETLRLPVDPPEFSSQAYLEAMMRDKKVKDGRLRLILNLGIGDCRIESVADPATLFAGVLD